VPSCLVYVCSSHRFMPPTTPSTVMTALTPRAALTVRLTYYTRATGCTWFKPLTDTNSPTTTARGCIYILNSVDPTHSHWLRLHTQRQQSGAQSRTTMELTADLHQVQYCAGTGPFSTALNCTSFPALYNSTALQSVVLHYMVLFYVTTLCHISCTAFAF
jgi:hypothetical protein